MALKARTEIASHLNCHAGDPILKLERKMATSRQDYNFYSSIYCNTGSFYLEGSF